ncbi:MAG: serine protease [Candidatus Acetothermia bacterium]|jgi:S1-C subfamily serine protease|nr:serine protease [Candidatus Acetothermia bacterium]
MARKLILVLTLVLLALAGGLEASQFDFSQLLGQISPAVVKVIVSYDREGRTWAEASGFILDPQGRVITACHAVIGAFGIRVSLRDGSSYPASVERCWPDDLEAKLFDVALLRLEGVSTYLPQNWLGDSGSVYLGETVFILGYPGPYGEFNVAQGQITARLPRQYITMDERVYRLGYIFELALDDRGYIDDILGALDLEAASPTLAELARLVRPGMLLIGFEEPGLDRAFCGTVAEVRSDSVGLEEVNCSTLFSVDRVVKTGRRAQLDREVEFLRTDAPMNAGSSGGPLFNLSGQVIGIASWGRTVELEVDATGSLAGVTAWQGANFVVPSAVIAALVASSP